MKTLLTISTLVFTVTFSSTSFGEWTKVTEDMKKGDTFYVDFDRIRKQDGFVYFWDLLDRLKPDEFGTLSDKVYKQGDCKLFRFKNLSFSFHNEPMGNGTGDVEEPDEKDWKYPNPNSMGGIVLKSVCSR